MTTKTSKKAFETALAALVRRHGVARLARRIEVTSRTIERWLAGERRPSSTARAAVVRAAEEEHAVPALLQDGAATSSAGPGGRGRPPAGRSEQDGAVSERPGLELLEGMRRKLVQEVDARAADGSPVDQAVLDIIDEFCGGVALLEEGVTRQELEEDHEAAFAKLQRVWTERRARAQAAP